MASFSEALSNAVLNLSSVNVASNFVTSINFFSPPLTHTLIGSHIMFFSLLRGIFL